MNSEYFDKNSKYTVISHVYNGLKQNVNDDAVLNISNVILLKTQTLWDPEDPMSTMLATLAGNRDRSEIL